MQEFEEVHESYYLKRKGGPTPQQKRAELLDELIAKIPMQELQLAFSRRSRLALNDLITSYGFKSVGDTKLAKLRELAGIQVLSKQQKRAKMLDEFIAKIPMKQLQPAFSGRHRLNDLLKSYGFGGVGTPIFKELKELFAEKVRERAGPLPDLLWGRPGGW